ncbi:MAG: cobalamin-binding protein [Azonexus sp.]|jgi:iron complex transport system substrate-binding protein|nr:cobalamin-binding protein [Azonexus sp.]
MKFLSGIALIVACLSVPPLARAEIAVKDDAGHDVRLPQPAQRIVTLAPHLAELLFAAGAGEKLVGAVDYSDYPPAAKKAARVGGYDRLDLEAIAALKPDLALAWESGNNPAQIDRLRALGVTVYLSEPSRMADVASQIERLGQLAGSEAVAQAAARRFRARLDTLRAANADKPKVRVFYQLWNAPLMTVGGPQIISDAIALCGGVNIFAQIDRVAPTVNIEAVLAADPEVIIAAGMGDARPDWLRDWQRWPEMTAVKRDNLFHIDPDILVRHTPRLLDGAARLCADLDLARQRRPAR